MLLAAFQLSQPLALHLFQSHIALLLLLRNAFQLRLPLFDAFHHRTSTPRAVATLPGAPASFLLEVGELLSPHNTPGHTRIMPFGPRSSPKTCPRVITDKL